MYKQHKQYRLKQHDYASNGTYFITICTFNRARRFGEIKNGMVCLSDIGEIVANEWIKTESLRQNIILDAWVVMPDHFHGIIIIDGRNTPRRVPTFGIQPLAVNSIPSIVNQFKGTVARIAHKKGHPEFHWQSRYYDRILRTQYELDIVRNYIQNNPKNWGK